jgi:hypothetical protein
MQGLMDFIKLVEKEQKPMYTQIALIDNRTNENMFSLVSLWAGIGDANPIDRCKHLKAQNTELIRLLKLYQSDLESCLAQ